MEFGFVKHEMSVLGFLTHVVSYVLQILQLAHAEKENLHVKEILTKGMLIQCTSI